MRYTLVVVVLAGTLLLAGCVDAPDDGTAIESTDAGADGTEMTDREDEDQNGLPDETVSGELEIHHLDVGQADATLVVWPSGETMVIDTGDWRQDGSEVIEYLEAHDIDRIDHLVATHGHADHIGGHAALIEHYETEHDGIGAAYDSGVAHTSQTYDNYLDAIETYDIDLFVVEEGQTLPVSNHTTVSVLNPPAGDSGTDLHYNSIALAIEFGEFRYLTTGDAEANAEERLLEDWVDDLNVSVYQAGHHGSSTSSTEAFMQAVQPEIAVISSAFDSQYGHPGDAVLERFADHGIETYWTAVHGDIVVTTDGTNISIEVTEAVSSDPLDLLEKKPSESDDSSRIALGPLTAHTPTLTG